MMINHVQNLIGKLIDLKTKEIKRISATKIGQNR